MPTLSEEQIRQLKETGNYASKKTEPFNLSFNTKVFIFALDFIGSLVYFNATNKSSYDLKNTIAAYLGTTIGSLIGTIIFCSIILFFTNRGRAKDKKMKLTSILWIVYFFVLIMSFIFSE